MKTVTVEDFYKDAAERTDSTVRDLLPADINKQIGHFNVFNLNDIIAKIKKDPTHVPYNRRLYYKINLVRGRNIAEYADKVINIESIVPPRSDQVSAC